MSEIGMGIGALSKATGVPVNTLRTWERRYGVPAPTRTEGGQRIYDTAEVHRLRMVARALEKGHRPGQIMKATVPELQALLGEVASLASPPPLDGFAISDTTPMMEAVRRLDGDMLEAALCTELARLGMVEFLEDRAAPFLGAIGCAWQEGKILPYQEHFASEHLRDFLAAQWRRMSDVARGPVAVCAALPGERHHLGLHLVAAVLAAQDWKIIFLGGDTPVSDVEACVRQVNAQALMISVSSVASPQDSRWMLRALRTQMEPEVALVVGGAGAPGDLPGVIHINDLHSLSDWAAEKRALLAESSS
ncbi:MAG TPA: MerR family transcriptional regulator [Myxococcota bacterium]|nr:MerR family transcriptional regulator [Myxococcota bacterium]HNH46891.1 MerR family transcriptional regulator [Myxococcota bacterium]